MDKSYGAIQSAKQTIEWMELRYLWDRNCAETHFEFSDILWDEVGVILNTVKYLFKMMDVGNQLVQLKSVTT